jgi:hypothetical protein
MLDSDGKLNKTQCYIMVWINEKFIIYFDSVDVLFL